MGPMGRIGRIRRIGLIGSIIVIGGVKRLVYPEGCPRA